MKINFQTNNLPSTTGIYIFKRATEILYIGKSVNIKARVRSHIENAKLGARESLIINSSNHIESIITDSEFKALLLEAELIQKHHPKYNVIWRDNKSHLYIKITVTEKYPKVLLVRHEDDHKSKYFGPFSSVRTAIMLLREIRKLVPFCTQPRLTSKPCFYSKIGLCNPCPSEIDARLKMLDARKGEEMKKEYRRNIRLVMKILSGKVDSVLKGFYRLMKELSKEKNYEESIKIRNRILRLEELLYNRSLPDESPHEYNQSERSLSALLNLLKEYFPDLNSLHRIECYDISNLLQKYATASMVVLRGGLIQKAEYKRFKIRNPKLRSDFEMLGEVLKRRFENKWELPNLVVIDGGKPQIRSVLKVFENLNITIPVVGIAKNPDRLVLGKTNLQTLRFIRDNVGFNIVRLMRDESHRFARKYHLFLRDRNFLL